MAPLYASNLTVEVPEYSDAQLDGMIRHGVHPERKTVWGMPSEIFQHPERRGHDRAHRVSANASNRSGKASASQFSKLDKEEIAAGGNSRSGQPRCRKRTQLRSTWAQHSLGRYITE